MSTSLLTRLKGEQLAAITAQRARIAEAEERGGLTAEDEAFLAETDTAFDSRQTHIDTLTKAAKRDAAYGEAVEQLPVKTSVDEARDRDNDVLMRMIRGELREHDFAVPREELRAINSKLSAGAGLNLVATGFYASLFVAMRDLSGIMAANATVLNTTQGNDIQLPMSNGFAAATLLTEGDAIGASNPTFAQTTIGAYKFGHLSQISEELITDAGVDAVGYLAEDGGTALGHGVGGYLITGTGTAQPTGIAGSAGFATVASASGSAAAGFTYDDVITLYHSIIRPYRSGASFICNDSVVKTLRKLRDGSGGAGTGQYLWQPAMTAGEPDTLAGRPIYTDPAMPTATTTTGKGLAFGNWKRGVVVRIAGGVRVESSRDYAFNTDLTTWRFITRADARIVDTSAARVLTYLT